VDSEKILDVGCGFGKWGHLIRILYAERNIRNAQIMGVDIECSHLHLAKKIYDSVIGCCASCLPFPSNSFDTVLVSEVIEHLPRWKGFNLIRECERVAEKKVIITTPSMRTVSLYSEHICYWKPSDFKRLGYKVYGVRGYPRLVSTNVLVQLILAFAVAPFSYWFPTLSSNVIAVKSVDVIS